MTGRNFSDQFDLLFNNIASNQAAGLNEYEKSVLLTKAQDELVKNYFLPQSNPKQVGYDDTAKRQMDFSMLMRSHGCEPVLSGLDDSGTISGWDFSDNYASPFDPRGKLFVLPADLFLPINESLDFVVKNEASLRYTIEFQRQVIPLSMGEYTRLMSKPYKQPLKNQAWRLTVNNAANSTKGEEGKLVEIIAGHNDLHWVNYYAEHNLPVPEGDHRIMQYNIRYVRRPKPIIVANIDEYGVTIHGKNGTETSLYTLNQYGDVMNPCELDESLHEEILQRAVELAEVAWKGDLQATTAAGNRSE